LLAQIAAIEDAKPPATTETKSVSAANPALAAAPAADAAPSDSPFPETLDFVSVGIVPCAVLVALCLDFFGEPTLCLI
jgi:hypothetical protein